MTQAIRMPVIVLLGIALGSSLLSSSLLAGALLLLAMAGGWVIATGRLPQSRWTPPKELRLIHFGFWFFVLVSMTSWAINGFGYDGFKALGTHARLLLFWPLVIALTWAGLRARHLFLIAPLIPLAAISLLLIVALQSAEGLSGLPHLESGGVIDPVRFGKLTLLGSGLTLIASVFFLQDKRKGFALSMIAIAGAGILASFFSGTMDNHIQLKGDAWPVAIEAVKQAPWFGLGPGNYGHTVITAVESGHIPLQSIQCCTGHAHNDALQIITTRGTIGLLSLAFLLAIPLIAFARLANHPNKPAACLAVAGVMVVLGYLIFGLTESIFDRRQFLTIYLAIVAAIAAALFNEILRSFILERKVTVTATVITKNEEDHIADCLVSARQVADQIVVLDSGSTDRTVEIARQYADIVEVTDWPGFGIQKQRALDKATGEWVLSIDADERVTPELAREMNHILANPGADAYKLPWAVTIYGKRLDFGRSGRAPLRLFRRDGVRFSEALVHERILIPEGRTVRTLRGRLLHFTHRDYGHALLKGAQYAWLGSEEKYRQGKRSYTLVYASLRGLLTFVHIYIVRFGFLDGSVGYLQASLYGQVTFNKYAGLWTLTKADTGKSLKG